VNRIESDQFSAESPTSTVPSVAGRSLARSSLVRL